jgi:hypothetical protein
MKDREFSAVQVIDLCTKYWLPPKYNFGLQFDGEFSWSFDKVTRQCTAHPDLYRQMLMKYYQKIELREYVVNGDQIAVGAISGQGVRGLA